MISPTKTQNNLPYPTALGLLLALLAFSYSVQPIQALVVPSELPTILSLVYSNIPPIKKGTDSRFGFGFRLGEHADFQVLLELGPQTNTQPIGDPDADSSYSKRQLDKNELRKQYWRQQAKLKQQQLNEAQQYATSTERNAANWLQNWSSDMRANKNNNNKQKIPVKTTKSTKKQTDNTPIIDGMPTMPVVAADALTQLQRLYRLATTTSTAAPAPSHQKLPYFGGSLNLGPPAGFTTPQQDLENFQEAKSKKEITKELMDVSLE